MKIIIANWKNHPSTLIEAQELFRAEVSMAEQYKNVQTVICPPKEFLEQLARDVVGTVFASHSVLNSWPKCLRDKNYVPRKSLAIGAQDVFWEKSSDDFLVSHVLVGHSDRRYDLGETDEVVNFKLKTALGAGVVPILFVGEKEKGENREKVLLDQLTKDLIGLLPEQIAKILFCYEPVWAISTNPVAEADSPENALEAIKFIQNFIAEKYHTQTIHCLYGGSVNENNVAVFLNNPEINGVVVGGASLHLEKFANVLKIVANIKE